MSVSDGRCAERDILIAGARVALDTADPAHLEATLDREVDWSFCKQEAVRHGVVSLLCDAFDRSDAVTDLVPTDVRDELENYRRATARRNLRLTGKLVNLVDYFDDADVDVLPFKGPVLAEKAYGDLTARRFADLDLLVRPEAFPAAEQILRTAGYRERSSETPTHTKIERQFGRVKVFLTDDHVVELHQRLLHRRCGRGIRVDRLFERATTVDVAGTTIPTVPPEETLVIAAVHGTKHRWERLEWLCAVVALLDRTDPDWTRVRREAEAVGKTRALALTMALARDVLGTSLPAAARALVEDVDGVEDQCARLADSMLEPSEPAAAIQKLRFLARTLADSRVRFWTRFLVTPHSGDVDFLPLPPRLTRGYHLVRPVRLALKLAQLGGERLLGQDRW